MRASMHILQGSFDPIMDANNNTDLLPLIIQAKVRSPSITNHLTACRCCLQQRTAGTVSGWQSVTGTGIPATSVTFMSHLLSLHTSLLAARVLMAWLLLTTTTTACLLAPAGLP